MNGHPNNIDTNEATEHLKNILKVGKSEMESGKVKTVSNGNAEVPNDSLALTSVSHQKVELHANKDSTHVQLYGTDVDVYSSPLEYGATCSQVIVEDLVDYGWEEKYYYGNLVSIHLGGVYFAYVLKPANNKPGFVRIWHKHLNVRHLIKDYKNEVKDIAFAHKNSEVLLGSVDACGELFVHKISDDGNNIICNLLLHIVRPSDWLPSEHNLITWCLYIPDDSDNWEDNPGEDVTTLLVVTHNERAEILNVAGIVVEHGEGNLRIDEIESRVQIITEHSTPITAATFSPDGTALAIGSIDGIVKFYQVSIPESDVPPRCLHQWIPHPDKSLSSLYFLDNYRSHRPDVQFWKIAVTGADNNTELKIWTCENWNCLQTIKIHPNPDDSVMPCLKAEIDLSSKYLFLSDIKRKVLLILLIQQGSSTENALICSLSEYRVPLPVLSLTISSIGQSKVKTLDECKLSDEEEEIEEDTSNDDTFHSHIIKLFWIQTKSLQSCRILYKPTISLSLYSTESVDSLSQDSYVFKDGLSDISMDNRDISSRSLKDLDSSLSKGIVATDELATNTSVIPSVALPGLSSLMSPSYQKCTEVLLTPGDFTSPSHATIGSQYSAHHEEGSKSEPGGSLIDSLPVESCTLQRRKSSQHSATSSPSREVAEILAPTKAMNLDLMNASSIIVKEEVENIADNLSSFNLNDSTLISMNQEEYVKNWPQAPDPSENYRLSNMNNGDSSNHSEHFHPEREKLSSISLNIDSQMAKMSKNFDDLTQKLNSMTDVLLDQKCEIQGLQSEVKMLRQDQKINQNSPKEALLATKLEHTLSQTLVPHHSRVENLIAKKADDERRQVKRDLGVLSEEVSAACRNSLENALKIELSGTVVPQINRVLDTIAHKMQADFSQKLSNTDTSLKETFTKHLKGKAFTDSLAQTLTSSLQNVVQVACKEVFQNSVVPSLDKACNQMFQQLNELFSKGTFEYMQAFEKQSQKSVTAVESTTLHLKEEVDRVLKGIQDQIRMLSTKVESQNMDLLKQQMLGEVVCAVGEEVRRAVQQASRAPTPAPDPHLQKQHLAQLLRQGSLDEAFQQALSAMDVTLVLYVCENVSLDSVFGVTPCPLQQHVLLSLVNQLSSDLAVKTEIKVKYIEDVIASLDSDNPIIREHIHSVLDSLQQRISLFLQKSPNHKLARNLRRIKLAANSLIKC